METKPKPTEEKTETNNTKPASLPEGKESNPAALQTSAANYHQNLANSVRPTDKVCYESRDGLVRIEQLVLHAVKFPPSPYPCIVLAVRPADHARVRQIDGGYVEVMPTFREMEALVDAMNEAALASGKGKLYEVLQRVPEKTLAHKERWKAFNEARVAKRKQPGKWWGTRYKRPHKTK